MTLKVGSLFAGYGGLSLAVEEVFGAELAWYADCCKFDKQGNASHHSPCRAPCSIMAHHWPDIPNLGDVTKVDWASVPPIDILDGGSPCQDLSHAGKRAGMTEGTRSNLWVAMREAIAQLRPRYVVWENVRGAYSAAADSEMGWCDRCLVRHRSGGKTLPPLRALGRVLGDLSDLGYDCRWHGLRAADVGAPHGRFRVFVIATDTNSSGRGERRRAFPIRQEHPAAQHPREDALTLLPTPAVNDMGAAYTPETWDAWTAAMQAKHGNGNGHGKSLEIESQRLLPTPRASDGPDASSHGRTGIYADAIHRWEQLFRDAPPPTDPNSKGNPRLSPRFSEWLMGAADGWVTDVPGITRNEALKALGNGVVTQQAVAALRQMLAWEMVA